MATRAAKVTANGTSAGKPRGMVVMAFKMAVADDRPKKLATGGGRPAKPIPDEVYKGLQSTYGTGKSVVLEAPEGKVTEGLSPVLRLFRRAAEAEEWRLRTRYRDGRCYLWAEDYPTEADVTSE